MNGPNGVDEIRHIVIVGGGTAGWITASLLNRVLRPNGYRITLVESVETGIIGVGEATVPTLLRFLRFMKIDEVQFMRATSATYKLGIKFVDWIETGHSYWHPFGVCGGSIDRMDMFHFWSRLRLAGGTPEAYGSYALQTLLAEAYKAPRSESDNSPITDSSAYAFHLDAMALAEFLRSMAVSEGVDHKIDHVQDIALTDSGDIAFLRLKRLGELRADFFVDCTGFAGRLIGSGLQQHWIDWSDQLLCDRVVTIAEEPKLEQPVNPFTLSLAQEAGWIWRIPLQHRIGTGYVFSRHHTDDETAMAALLANMKGPVKATSEPRFLDMRIGRRQNFWQNNCVAIGLSAGFLEPLESTGIYLIQRSVELLLDYLPVRRSQPNLAAAYNRRLGAIYDEVRDFVLLHYVLNRRQDTEFWRDAREVKISSNLEDMLALYDEAGHIEPGRKSLFGETSLYHILTGSGRLPQRATAHVANADLQRIAGVLAKMHKQNRAAAVQLPDHGWLLRRLHKNIG